MMTEQLKTFSGKVNTGLKVSGEAARSGANALYTQAMNNPRTAAAVVLGTGVAAAVIWAVSRNGTFESIRKQVLGRTRRAPARSRKR